MPYKCEQNSLFQLYSDVLKCILHQSDWSGWSRWRLEIQRAERCLISSGSPIQIWTVGPGNKTNHKIFIHTYLDAWADSHWPFKRVWIFNKLSSKLDMHHIAAATRGMQPAFLRFGKFSHMAFACFGRPQKEMGFVSKRHLLSAFSSQRKGQG